VLAGALDHARAAGLDPQGLVASPLLGPAGNREFFLLAAAPPLAEKPVDWAERIGDLVPV
jgi:hypothetical protein